MNNTIKTDASRVVAHLNLCCVPQRWWVGLLLCLVSATTLAQTIARPGPLPVAVPDAVSDAEVANNYYRYSNAQLEILCATMSPNS